MDYKDFKAGHTSETFWFKAKKDFIDIILSKNIKKNSKILNIGCGTGDDLRIISKYGTLYLLDSDKKALDLIKEKSYKKIVGDACHLKFPSNFFDVIVIFDVLEHIVDDRIAVKEMYRVLKEKGLLIFTVPAFQCLFSSHDVALEHKRRYNKKRLNVLFKEFKIKEIGYWNFSTFFPLAVLRILKKGSKPKVDAMSMPKLLDLFLYKIMSLENKLIKSGIKMPFGLTIYGICNK
jgi:ubiquinone/menaquinone biosynthesis C-methylase UbiE